MNRRALVKSVVLLLVGSCWIASPVAQAAAWDIQIVQDSSRNVRFSPLAHDAAGNPSIAYLDLTTGEIRLAVRFGGSWNMESIGSANPSNLDHAYDSGGTPSVAYLAGQGSGYSLFFATRSGTSWTIERVRRRVGGTSLCLAYGPDGNPSIAFADNNELLLATRANEVWSTQTVEGQISVGSEVSLAHDSTTGGPAVAYTVDSVLKYARWNGASWEIEVVDNTSANKRMTSLAYDSGSGEATIAYWRRVSGSADEVRFARRSAAASWQLDLVASGAGASLAYDTTGTPYVGYRNDPDNDELLIAHHDGVGWMSEVVETSPTTLAYSTKVPVALDPTDNPALSFLRRASVNGPFDLRFASRPTRCTDHADCSDASDCTIDTCDFGSGDCRHDPVADDTSCNDATGICCAGACTAAVCSANIDCDDGDTCSTDVCMSLGTCAAFCENTFPTCGGTADGCCAPGCDYTNDSDCPSPPDCVPTHDKEKGPRCSDEIDNDCDGLTDGDDPDC